MSCVTLTFEVWVWVKVTAHRLNEDNISTKLDGNPSNAYVSYRADTTMCTLTFKCLV